MNIRGNNLDIDLNVYFRYSWNVENMIPLKIRTVTPASRVLRKILL